MVACRAHNPEVAGSNPAIPSNLVTIKNVTMIRLFVLSCLLFAQDFSRDTIDLLFAPDEKIVLTQSDTGVTIYYSRELDRLVCSQCLQTKCMLARESFDKTDYICVSCVLRKIKQEHQNSLFVEISYCERE